MSELQWAWGMQAKRRVPYHEAKKRAAEKKKREQEETAAAYADFVEAFDGPGDQESTFVGGETITQGPQDPGPVVANPSSAMPKKLTLSTRKVGPKPGLFDDPDEVAPKKTSKKSGNPKAIDALLQEMKQSAGHYAPGDNRNRDYIRRDMGELPDQSDENTTNLYVGNISSSATEETLRELFGQFGQITSIKIMWPRTDEEKTRPHNCGFVSFATRPAAEAAKRKLDGENVLGSPLKIDWSKPVKAVGVPMVMAPNAKESVLAQLKAGHKGGFSSKPLTAGFSAKASADIKVEIPSSRKTKERIDLTALNTAVYGYPFEAALMETKTNQSDFMFLFEKESPEHQYYRWRCWADAQGDSEKNWKTSKFRMFEDGPWWYPPLLPGKDADAEDNWKRGAKEKTKLLSDRQYDEFSNLLRSITVSRETIKDAMVYCLDHSEYSGDIVKCIKEALTLKETPAITKVARLYLVSDILHNSSAPVKNASSYRSGFDSVLREIMKSFRVSYQEQGRASAAELKKEVLKVLEVWERWSIYPSNMIAELICIFEDREYKRDAGTNEDIDGVPMDDIDGAPMDADPVDDPTGGLTEEELDGEPLATGGGLGPDLRLLPKTELENLCSQQGLATDGDRNGLIDRILEIDVAAQIEQCKKRRKIA